MSVRLERVVGGRVFQEMMLGLLELLPAVLDAAIGLFGPDLPADFQGANPTHLGGELAQIRLHDHLLGGEVLFLFHRDGSLIRPGRSCNSLASHIAPSRFGHEGIARASG
ncbi:MAG: hypothetical protein GC162_17125 [Planctomycetes bacterium]|nr:hypothetical protein [Planctomycetota bacterium]